jgi:ABC-type uncharacterized transport system involved in gliding motility auxiliary subunit
MAISNPFTRYLFGRLVLQGLLVLGIVIFGFLLVRDQVLRWDLTEDKRYTISDASYRLADELEDPLTIRAYFSAEVPPLYEPLQRQVFDILAEYEAHSGGKIRVERYDPDESKAARDEAENYNIRFTQLPVQGGTSLQVVNLYGAIVLLYRDRASEVIDIASRYRQGYEGLSVLEYEISSRIWQLSNERPTLGLTGYLAVEPPSRFPGAPPQGPARPEFEGLRRLLGEAFEIEDVDLKSAAPDPGEIPLLLIVRPKEFSDVEIFRLDQYLMKGGRVLMFVTQGTVSQQMWGQGKTAQQLAFKAPFQYQPFPTGLDAWLEHHGLRVPNEFVLHAQNAYQIGVPRILDERFAIESYEPNWFWPQISSSVEGALSKDNPAIQSLRGVTLLWAHPIDVLETKLGADLTSTVLVRSHKAESWRWKDLSKVDYRSLNPRNDLADPDERKASPLAVAVEGRFSSYFAERPVPPSLIEADSGAEGEEKAEGEEAAPKGPEVVKQSVDSTQLVVVGNSFFISDLVLGGQRADDRARQATLLAFNLVDWLARSKELIALRAKRYTTRALVEKDFEDEIEKIQARYDASNKTQEDVDRAKGEYEEAKENQKLARKRARWLNSALPAAAVLLLGMLVLILRTARRAQAPTIPAAIEPESLSKRQGD